VNAHGALLQLHLFLAVTSGLWFGARAIWRLGLQKSIQGAFWRRAPHLIDTLLLASGLTLAWQAHLLPHLIPWFGIKLILVLLYIALGIAAFRSRRPIFAKKLALSALLVWAWILGMGLNRSTLGWLT